MRHSEERNYRISVYFDCICGLLSSTLALIAIIFTTIKFGIRNPKMYTVGLTFWICWLIFSLFLIGLGIYTHMKNKNFDESKARKDIRPPII